MSENRMNDSALVIQWRVLHALILRDIKGRFGGRRLGFVWALLEPCLFMAVFVALFQFIGRSNQSGIPVPLFLITGIAPFLMFRDVYASIANEVKGISPLLMFPQVSKTDLIAASFIVNVLISITVLIFLLCACYAMGYEFKIQEPLTVLFMLFVLWSFGLGLGLFVGGLSIRYEFVNAISQAVLGRPLFLASGLFFTAEMMPAEARQYALYNPILHCIEAVRTAMFASFDSRYIDMTYVLYFAVVLLALGFMIMNFFERQRR